MRKKQARRGAPTRSVAEARLAELRPVLLELNSLSDSAIARELNKRSLLTLNGGEWGDSGVQVARLRRRLGLVRDTKSREASERRFRQIRRNLGYHFGPEIRLNETQLLDITAEVATEIDRTEQIFNLSDLSKLSAAGAREYLRARALLGRLLECLRVASDTFEKRNPPELPLAPKKSIATQIAEDSEIACRVAAALAPKMATDRASRK
jgi:hypothetical protein